MIKPYIDLFCDIDDECEVTRDYTDFGIQSSAKLTASEIIGLMPVEMGYAVDTTMDAYFKLPGHNRVIYMSLPEVTIAFKGATLTSELQKAIPNLERSKPIVQTAGYFSSLNWFLCHEHEVPYAQDIFHCHEEFDRAAAYHGAYQATFNEAPNIITPLFVIKYPDSCKQRYITQVRPFISNSHEKFIFDRLMTDDMGVFVYELRGSLERYRAIRTDLASVQHIHSRKAPNYEVIEDEVVKALVAGYSLCDPEHVINSRFESLRRASNDEYHQTSGQCIQAQNITHDNIICDINSIIPIRPFINDDVKLKRVLYTIVRELSMWKLGGNAFFSEALTYDMYFLVKVRLEEKLKSEMSKSADADFLSLLLRAFR